jgi:hypothetical protein
VPAPFTSLHVPAQPLHERTNGYTPVPHVVLQLPATFHAVQLFCAPALHGPDVVLLPRQLSAQPVQKRCRVSVPAPQKKEQLVAGCQSVHLPPRHDPKSVAAPAQSPVQPPHKRVRGRVQLGEHPMVMAYDHADQAFCALPAHNTEHSLMPAPQSP